jgi:glycosyltransferase involved in cell wall biosynthesis
LAVRSPGNRLLVPHSPDHRVALGWFGPPEHGVTDMARRIAAAATDLGFAGPVVGELDAARVAELVDRLPAPVRLLHLHVSDWLIADATADPDRVIDGLAGAAAARGLALSVTLHDLPGPGDPPELGARRAATYRRLVDAAAGVAVCSEHERSLLHERVAPGRAVTVIPLPIDPLAAHPSPPAGGDGGGGDGGEPTVAIFGFLYPGKGHRDVIEELAEFGPPVTVLAIGRPSARHPDLVDELAEAARARGLSFRCTGYVPEEQVLDRLRAPVIPVAPQTSISASGSINSWLTAGRRPLVRAGRYAAELGRRLPGSVQLYPPGALADAVRRAQAEPATTWLPAGLELGPTTPTVARRYLDWLTGLAERAHRPAGGSGTGPGSVA